jgi:hypothetical protein
LAGVITHRSRLDRTTAVFRHLDLPIVVPALAVVQVADTCHPVLVKSVANDLVKRHWTTFPAILEWIERVGDGRRQDLRDLCLRAIDVGGHFDSPPARALCAELTQAGAPPFQTDYQVKAAWGILLVDIAWPPLKVGIEYNGARDHAHNPLARRDDPRRHNRLTALGWSILHVDKGMSMSEIVDWALDTLAAASGGLQSQSFSGNGS